MKSKFLVISLDRTPDRWTGFQERFLELMGFSPERVSAVDGRIEEQQIKAYSLPLSDLLIPRLMTCGEIACYLSHIKCWELFLESGSDWALIMEDDVFFCPIGRKFISSPDWIPNGVDVCQIGAYKEEPEKAWISKNTITLQDNMMLVKMMHPVSYGTQAYWINRKAALVGVKLSSKIRNCVDNFLFDQFSSFSKYVEVWSLGFFVAYQKVDQLGSLLEDDRFLQTKLKKKNPLKKLIESIDRRLQYKRFYRKKINS